ncbi:MAG TPA: class I tRNA ligase family protein, partial [Chloroflexota bacterium]|nr:class I tRNA ligase family protein [Chloroflexota bacterium]
TCPKCQGSTLHQDPDVLDTWFSAGLWPFSTLGWPKDTEDLRYFYPTSVMETGYDIIFFWVARMIMFGLEFTGKPPFDVVYLHGLLRDEKGEKMSKSKGNVRNPLEVIGRYGADALRYALVTGSTPGNDVKLSDEKLEGARNFANKLWNAARYVLTTGTAPSSAPNRAELSTADRWILSRASRTIADVTRLFEEFEFSEAGRILYEFVWSEFCDWYIEIAKIQLRSGDEARQATTRWVLFNVLEDALKLLQPFMPYVTQAIWDFLPNRREMVIVAAWPSPGPIDEVAENELALVVDLIRAIRNVRTEFKVDVTRRIPAVVAAGNHHTSLDRERTIVESLARVHPFDVASEVSPRPQKALHLLVGGVEVYLPLAGMVDLEAERERATVELSRLQAQITGIEQRLSQPGFIAKAPPAIVDRERERRESLLDQVTKLEERLAALA